MKNFSSSAEVSPFGKFEATARCLGAGVAKEHNSPAYVIFHDATLAAIAERVTGRGHACSVSAAATTEPAL